MIGLMGRKSHGLFRGLKGLWWFLSLALSDLGFPAALLIQGCWATGGKIWGRKESLAEKKNVCSAGNREVVCGLWMVLRFQNKQRGWEG